MEVEDYLQPSVPAFLMLHSSRYERKVLIDRLALAMIREGRRADGLLEAPLVGFGRKMRSFVKILGGMENARQPNMSLARPNSQARTG